MPFLGIMVYNMNAIMKWFFFLVCTLILKASQTIPLTKRKKKNHVLASPNKKNFIT